MATERPFKSSKPFISIDSISVRFSTDSRLPYLPLQLLYYFGSLLSFNFWSIFFNAIFNDVVDTCNFLRAIFFSNYRSTNCPIQSAHASLSMIRELASLQNLSFLRREFLKIRDLSKSKPRGREESNKTRGSAYAGRRQVDRCDCDPPTSPYLAALDGFDRSIVRRDAPPFSRLGERHGEKIREPREKRERSSSPWKKNLSSALPLYGGFHRDEERGTMDRDRV